MRTLDATQEALRVAGGQQLTFLVEVTLALSGKQHWSDKPITIGAQVYDPILHDVGSLYRSISASGVDVQRLADACKISIINTPEQANRVEDLLAVDRFEGAQCDLFWIFQHTGAIVAAEKNFILSLLIDQVTFGSETATLTLVDPLLVAGEKLIGRTISVNDFHDEVPPQSRGLVLPNIFGTCRGVRGIPIKIGYVGYLSGTLEAGETLVTLREISDDPTQPNWFPDSSEPGWQPFYVDIGDERLWVTAVSQISNQMKVSPAATQWHRDGDEVRQVRQRYYWAFADHACHSLTNPKSDGDPISGVAWGTEVLQRPRGSGNLVQCLWLAGIPSHRDVSQSLEQIQLSPEYGFASSFVGIEGIGGENGSWAHLLASSAIDPAYSIMESEQLYTKLDRFHQKLELVSGKVIHAPSWGRTSRLRLCIEYAGNPKRDLMRSKIWNWDMPIKVSSPQAASDLDTTLESPVFARGRTDNLSVPVGGTPGLQVTSFGAGYPDTRPLFTEGGGGPGPTTIELPPYIELDGVGHWTHATQNGAYPNGVRDWRTRFDHHWADVARPVTTLGGGIDGSMATWVNNLWIYNLTAGWSPGWYPNAGDSPPPPVGPWIRYGLNTSQLVGQVSEVPQIQLQAKIRGSEVNTFWDWGAQQRTDLNVRPRAALIRSTDGNPNVLEVLSNWVYTPFSGLNKTDIYSWNETFNISATSQAKILRGDNIYLYIITGVGQDDIHFEVDAGGNRRDERWAASFNLLDCRIFVSAAAGVLIGSYVPIENRVSPYDAEVALEANRATQKIDCTTMMQDAGGMEAFFSDRVDVVINSNFSAAPVGDDATEVYITRIYWEIERYPEHVDKRFGEITADVEGMEKAGNVLMDTPVEILMALIINPDFAHLSGGLIDSASWAQAESTLANLPWKAGRVINTQEPVIELITSLVHESMLRLYQENGKYKLSIVKGHYGYGDSVISITEDHTLNPIIAKQNQSTNAIVNGLTVRFDPDNLRGGFTQSIDAKRPLSQAFAWRVRTATLDLLWSCGITLQQATLLAELHLDRMSDHRAIVPLELPYRFLHLERADIATLTNARAELDAAIAEVVGIGFGAGQQNLNMRFAIDQREGYTFWEEGLCKIVIGPGESFFLLYYNDVLIAALTMQGILNLRGRMFEGTPNLHVSRSAFIECDAVAGGLRINTQLATSPPPMTYMTMLLFKANGDLHLAGPDSYFEELGIAIVGAVPPCAPPDPDPIITCVHPFGGDFLSYATFILRGQSVASAITYPTALNTMSRFGVNEVRENAIS